MATKTETNDVAELERSIEHDIDTELSDDSALATLSERAENRLQMDEIRRRTIAPGVMRLNVKRVVSAENSLKWAIDLDHPVRDDDDTIRVFVEKPVEGWTRDYKLVRLLDWYGIDDVDPHSLEFYDVVVEKDEEASEYAHGWRLVEPPDYDAPIRTQLRRRWNRLVSVDGPSRSLRKMWGVLLAGSICGAVASMVVGTGVLSAVIIGAATFMVATTIGMAFVTPPGDE